MDFLFKSDIETANFFWTIVYAIGLVMALHYLQSWILYFWRKFQGKEPPGPFFGVPFFGQLLFLNKKTPYKTLTRYARKYGPIYKISLGRVPTVVLSDVGLIREIFKLSELEGRAPLHLTHGIMNGYGLICAEGERWREQRRFVNQTLKNIGMVRLSDYRRESLEKRIKEIAIIPLIAMIKDKMNTEEFNFTIYMQHFIGSLINDIVFGVHWSIDSPKWLWLQELQEKGTELIGVSGVLNFLPNLRYFPSHYNTINFIKNGQKKSHEFYNLLAKQYEDNLTDNDTTPSHIMGAYLKEQKTREEEDKVGSFTAKQRNYLLADMFGAGFDTTLTTLQWFFILVADNPSVQKKIQEELDSLYLNEQELPTLDNCNGLNFLKATIAETQRFRSVVPIGIPHGTLKDVEILGYHIAKGTMVIPLQWAVHMDPSKWKDPETFRPENFLTEQGHFYKPTDFFPFQTGKRRCVGEEMAHQILLLFTASLLREFNIRLGHPAKLEGICGITLKPREHQFVVESRNRQ